MSDVVSPRLLFTVAVLAAGASNFAFSVSDSFSLFVAAWALNGVVQGLGWPVPFTLLPASPHCPRHCTDRHTACLTALTVILTASLSH